MTKTAGHLGVQQLVAHCLNPSCRHEGLIDVSKFADDIEVTWFAKKPCARNAVRPLCRRAPKPKDNPPNQPYFPENFL